MKIAVIGCLHGELDVIYDKIKQTEESQNIVIDLLLVCGDFQTVRNKNDLKCMAVPPKFQRLGTFYQYYFGEKVASKLTILIGGNHEASNYLQTLPYGGWVAPNMYYLGLGSVVKYRGLRIGGISGIFKMHDARLSHFEHLPYDNSTMRSIYHMREVEIYKFLQLSKQSKMQPELTNSGAEQTSNDTNVLSNHFVDIFMSHDWPINIDKCGNVNYLLKNKPFFRNEVNSGSLGNPLLQPLVHHLKPKHWFAAHLHVGFNATVNHQITSNDSSSNTNNVIKTQFQALDKVLPRRQFLKIVDVFPEEDNEKVKSDDQQYHLEYDAEWLAILKKTDHLLKIKREFINEIDIFNGANEIKIEDKDIKNIRSLFDDNLTVPDNFELCEPVMGVEVDNDPNRRKNFINPQTAKLCMTLGIRDPNEIFALLQNDNSNAGCDAIKTLKNPDEIDLSDSDCGESEETEVKKAKTDQSDFFIIDTKGSQLKY